jgi:outer membrane protein
MTRAWWVVPALLAAAPLGAQAVPELITLERAIELAQERAPAARSAVYALQAAHWQAQEFSSRFLPRATLSSQPSSFFRRIDEVTQPDGTTRFVPRSQMQSSLQLQVAQRLPILGGQLSFSSGLSRSGVGGREFWSASPVVVGLQQDLFKVNTLAWDAKAQTLSAEMAERRYLEQKEDVAGQTVTAFFAVFSAKTSLRNASANVAVNDTLYLLNKGRYEVGKISEDELLQSELALLRARASVEDRHLNFERALFAFRIQLGLPLDADVDVVPPVGIPEVAVDTALAVRSVLRNGSSAVSRELQLLQAERAVREARSSAGIAASINAQAGYNQSAQVFGDAYRDLLGQQSVSVSIQVPVLQWGAGKARVEAARAAQRQKEEEAGLQERQQTQDAYVAARELVQLQRQVSLSAKADTVAAKRFEVARNRYLVGKIDNNLLFTAQNEKDAALQAYVQSLGVYWAAYYRLRRLTLYDFAAGREIPRPAGRP